MSAPRYIRPNRYRVHTTIKPKVNHERRSANLGQVPLASRSPFAQLSAPAFTVRIKERHDDR